MFAPLWPALGAYFDCWKFFRQTCWANTITTLRWLESMIPTQRPSPTSLTTPQPGWLDYHVSSRPLLKPIIKKAQNIQYIKKHKLERHALYLSQLSVHNQLKFNLKKNFEERANAENSPVPPPNLKTSESNSCKNENHKNKRQLSPEHANLIFLAQLSFNKNKWLAKWTAYPN